MAALLLRPKTANLPGSIIFRETDGAISRELIHCNGPMAADKDSMSGNQRWQMVNYIRYLQKKSREY
jgi:hypothetical protein